MPVCVCVCVFKEIKLFFLLFYRKLNKNMSQGPEFEARLLSGDDAKSTRSSRSAVSTRTAISVTLPSTSGAGGEKTKVDIHNVGTGGSNASPAGEPREVTFSPGGPMAPVGTPTPAEAKKQQ